MEYLNAILTTRSDILLWILLWSIISFILSFVGQLAFFHCIEKKKLKKEREFSFKKEQLSKLQESAFSIATLRIAINNYLLSDYRENESGAWKGKESRSFKDIYPDLARIEAIIDIYFPDCETAYQAYKGSAENYFTTRNLTKHSSTDKDFAHAIRNNINTSKLELQ